MTVGVVGVGRIGGLFARKVSALGCRVIGTDPRFPDLVREHPELTFVAFDTLLAESDVISIHCPLDAATRGLFGTDALARMKPTAVLINTARGGIIDETALADALSRGAIGGAAIDTVAREPLAADSPLLSHPNCLVTPHMAWYSEESAEELNRKVAEEAIRFAKGGAVRYPVNTRSAAPSILTDTRRKLRLQLGHDVIGAKRDLGNRLIGLQSIDALWSVDAAELAASGAVLVFAGAG